MASEANTVSGAGEAVRTLDARTGQLRTDQPAPDQIDPASGGVERWYGCYGARGDLFTQDSNKHPAKMAVQLAYRIFEHGRQRGYWKPGDTILDPMGGIGTTGIVGASLGYDVVLLELEHHFLSLAAANIGVLRTKVGAPHFVCGQCGFRLSRWNRSMNGPHLCQDCGLYDLPIEAGKISLLQGDARQLSQVLARADAGITSPPYADKQITGQGHFRSQLEPEAAPAAANPREGYAGAVTSPVYGCTNLPVGCSWAVRKLAAVGQWDAAIDRFEREEQKQVDAGTRYSVRSRSAIRNIIDRALECEARGYGARAPDAVVSSPPFLQSRSGDGSDKVGERTYSRQTAGTSPAQIGNLPNPKNDIDAVLSSPPWENVSQEKRFKNPNDSITFAENSSLVRRGRSVEAVERAQEKRSAGYPSSNGQIGKHSGETYLSAMRQVYAQLHLVLKPGGVVCLVTKNPVKKGQIRRLDSDTIRLMEACGFTFLERQRAMLVEETEHGHLFEGTVIKRTEWESFFKRLFERTCFWKGGVLESEGRQRWDTGLKKFVDYRAVIKRECKHEEKADGKCPYYIQDAKEDPAVCPLYLSNREGGLGVDHEDILWFRKA